MDHLLALPQGTELVGDFSLKRVLGAGGFGITYLARDLQLDRNVAIKEYFPSEFAAREGAAMVRCRSQSSEVDYRTGLERFVDEAQALARFEHPNIVRVFRYFRANNTAYMVLQFEAGRSLKGWLDDLGRRPLQSELDSILLPLLDALELLHANDFLHRDIAPDNILIRPDGSPVLIDFGSARGDLAERSRTVSAIVKPGYSPFEQYSSRGQRQGPWTDIYALAATLYHAITGERPLDAPSRMSGSEIRPARAVGQGDYRPGFLAAIDQALMVRAESRPQSIAAWRRMLFGPTEPPRVYVGAPQQARALAPSPSPGPAQAHAQTHGKSPVEVTAHTTHLHAHAPAPGPQPQGSQAQSPQASVASPPQIAARPPAGTQTGAPSRNPPAAGMPPQQTRKIETGAAPPLVWKRHERPVDVARPDGEFPLSPAGREGEAVNSAPPGAPLGTPADVPRSLSRPPRSQPAVAAGLGLAGRLARALADKLQGAASAFDEPTHRPAPPAQAARPIDSGPSAPVAGATMPSSRFDEELQASVARVEAEIEAARLNAAKAVEARAAAAAREAKRLASREQAAARRAERRLERQMRWSAFEARLGAATRAGLRTGVRLALFGGIVFFAVKMPGLISQPNIIPTAAVGISLDAGPSAVGLARTLRGHEAPVLALAYGSADRRLISIDSAQGMLIWDLEGSEKPQHLRLDGESITALETDALQLLVGRATGALDVVDRRTGGTRAIRGGEGGAITAVALLRDGRRDHAVAAIADGSLRLYDLGRGRYRTMRDSGSPVTAMATATQTADELVIGGQDAAVRIYSLRRNRVLQTFHAHADGVSALAWAREAGLIASGSRDRSIKVWDPNSPASLKTLSGHEGTITALAFTPDGRHLVSASEDHTIRLWDLASGRLEHTFIGHTAAVRAIALIGDGAWLASAGDDESIRIWGLAQQPPGAS